MFGIARPCRHILGKALHDEWMGHLCGLCLCLRDGEGQAARASTNVDAVAVSILTEAQRRTRGATRRAGPCPLRGMRTQTVLAPDNTAARHAAGVSLTMAAVEITDHVDDGDGMIARVPIIPKALAGRWAAGGERLSAGVGFDAAALRARAGDAARVEARPGLAFDDYARPTEEAAALVCAHTAVLAERPGNAEALAELGRMFGRIVYLVDAVRDVDGDLADGSFNALVAVAGEAGERHRLAVELFADAHARLVSAFDRLELERPELARAIFVDQLARVGRRALRAGHAPGRDGCHLHAERAGGTVPGGPVVRTPSRSPGLAHLAATTVAAAGLGTYIFKPKHDMPVAGAPEGEGRRRRWWQRCGDHVDACDCCCCCCGTECCDSCDCDC